MTLPVASSGTVTGGAVVSKPSVCVCVCGCVGVCVCVCVDVGVGVCGWCSAYTVTQQKS